MTIGDSSPAQTATIASSTQRRPSSTRPSATRAWPCSWSASASRSASPNRSAITIASAAAASAPRLVAGDPPLDDQRQQEIAALDAVGPVPLHQPPGAGEPAAGARGLAPQGEAQPDPEGAARRAVGALVGADGALERRHELVVAAEHVGRRRELLEPAGVQLARQRREHGMRLPPRPRRAGITSRCHRGRDVHDDPSSRFSASVKRRGTAGVLALLPQRHDDELAARLVLEADVDDVAVAHVDRAALRRGARRRLARHVAGRPGARPRARRPRPARRASRARAGGSARRRGR